MSRNLNIRYFSNILMIFQWINDHSWIMDCAQ